MKLLFFDNCSHKISRLIHEHIGVSDPMSLGPIASSVGVIIMGAIDFAKSLLGHRIRIIEVVEIILLFKAPEKTSFFSVDFNCIIVPSSGCQACGFETTGGSGIKFAEKLRQTTDIEVIVVE